jgi:predicted DNA-binding transcriptional regulator YafY
MKTKQPTTGRNALIRYITLDACFANNGRKYTLNDLLEECNEALSEFSNRPSGISKRQLREDIRFMRSEQGWHINLITERIGKKYYYRYQDSNFSIFKYNFNQLEKQQLKEAFSVLQRFQGIPQFSWVEQIIEKLDISLDQDSARYISFEVNPYLKGMNYISELYSAISEKQTLNITYHSFRNKNEQLFTVSPYFLKQYNNRWYLFCKNKHFDHIFTLALDRIEQINLSEDNYEPNQIADDNDFFEDIIGVTINREEKLTPIQIRASRSIWPYIETKPLHGSQKVIERNDSAVIFQLSVIPNYELEKLIMSLGEEIEVLSPSGFRLKIANRYINCLKHYQ